MQKWEYKIYKFTDSQEGYRGEEAHHREMEAQLNKLGEDGWEIIGGFNIYLVWLKRPKED